MTTFVLTALAALAAVGIIFANWKRDKPCPPSTHNVLFDDSTSNVAAYGRKHGITEPWPAGPIPPPIEED